MAAYDHHLKAGNQGDVVKHPALIAALDKILTEQGQTATFFHYLDLFAGHAWHPLLDRKDYQWKDGIGKLSTKVLPEGSPAAVKCWWDLWHAGFECPTSPVRYPGSSWIAADRCRSAGRTVKLELYDYSEAVRRDLEKAFSSSMSQHANSDHCLIGQSLSLIKSNQQRIEEANFVFVDPPGWNSNDPSYPKWKDVLVHVIAARGDKNNNEKRPTLMWMPAGGHDRTRNRKNPKSENPGAYPWDEESNGEQRKKCKELMENGYSWTAVRWRRFSKNSGCILAYNCAKDEIRDAVDCVVHIAGKGWVKKHSA